MPRGGRGEWIARREGAGDGLVVRVPVVDAEARERVEERLLRFAQRHAILRTPRPGEGRLDGREVEVDHLGVRRRLVRVVPERVLLAVRLDERDSLLRTTGELEIPQRLGIHGEEPARRPVFRRHVPDRRAVGERQGLEPVPEVLDELPHDARLPQDLRHREDEVGRGRALGERAGQPEPDDLWDQHRDRLAEHRRLCLDPADSPPEHAEAVDHRRVRVGPDQGVGVRDPIPVLHHPREELEVDLVDDSRARRNDLEVVERALPPAQECVALAIPLELELRVPEDGAAGRELVDLYRVVDHELDGEKRIDLLGIAAEVVHRVAHRGQVDDCGDAREVLEQYAAGRERNLLRRLRSRDPAGDRLDVGGGHVDAVLHPQHVLEEDPQRVRQPQDVVARLQCVDAEDLIARAADVERRAGVEAVRMRHRTRFKQLGPGELVEPTLGECLAARIEVSRDGLRVRAPDAAGVGCEAFVAKRLEILRVRIEDVLAPDLPGGVEERKPHPERHLEERSLLPVGFRQEPLVDGRELGRGRKPLGVVPQVGERALEALHLERRDVDQACRGPARALEYGEQVVDRRELGLLCEHAGRFQLAHERVEVHASPSRDVGGGSEQPQRREPEREDRSQLDHVPTGLAHCELLRGLLELVHDASAPRSTPPTSSTVIRRRFLAVAS